MQCRGNSDGYDDQELFESVFILPDTDQVLTCIYEICAYRRMGDDKVVARLGSMKALLGIVAGAGASYGIYKLVFGRAGDAGVNRKKSAKSVTIQPGSLMAKVSGFKVVSKSDNLDTSADTESSK